MFAYADSYTKIGVGQKNCTCGSLFSYNRINEEYVLA